MVLVTGVHSKEMWGGAPAGHPVPGDCPGRGTSASWCPLLAGQLAGYSPGDLDAQLGSVRSGTVGSQRAGHCPSPSWWDLDKGVCPVSLV